MKDEKFRREFRELFSEKELSYLCKEAFWISEDENDEIDYFFFIRDRGMIEIDILKDSINDKDVEIMFVTIMDRIQYTKKEFMQFINDSKQKELVVLSVD